MDKNSLVALLNCDCGCWSKRQTILELEQTAAEKWTAQGKWGGGRVDIGYWIYLYIIYCTVQKSICCISRADDDIGSKWKKRRIFFNKQKTSSQKRCCYQTADPEKQTSQNEYCFYELPFIKMKTECRKQYKFFYILLSSFSFCRCETGSLSGSVPAIFSSGSRRLLTNVKIEIIGSWEVESLWIQREKS